MYSPKIDVEHENEVVEKTKKTSKNNQVINKRWKKINLTENSFIANTKIDA